MENRLPRLERLKNIWKSSPTIRNILKVSVGDVGSKMLSFATMFLLIRSLSIPDYASYTTFSSIAFLFSGIVGTGINMAVVRFSAGYISKEKEKPLALYFFAILIQLMIYILVAGLCFIFPSQATTLLIGQPAFAFQLQLGLLAGLGMLIIQFARSLYQAEERFNNYIGTLWLVQALIFASLAALWMLHYLSFVSIAITFSMVQLGIGIWILITYLRDFKLSNLTYLSLDQRVELKRFMIGSGWLIGYFLVLNLFSRMDILIILRFRGEEELAIYGVAFQYYSFALLLLGSIHAVLLPKFSRADMQNNDKQKAFLKRWLRWSIWLAVPITLFDLFGGPLFVWVNGRAYEKSFPIFVIFSFGIWLSMMFSPLVNIIISKGEFRFLFVLSVLALLFNFVSNILLIPIIGGIGAALVIILTQNIFIQIPILVKGLRLP